ncbi:MAG: 1-(5-phosphoribosyl)-5-[(5-phosphoribosylamino)methylideneamino]imidazole-4-carboxamide isomerase [Candidatus Binatia bacterium]
MLILPAIDLKGGRCVRLLRGDFAAETVYGDDPVAMGRRWVDGGARYLHVVDLDGAVSGAPVNGEAIAALCADLPVPVQVGGGIRTVERAAELLERGAARVIFGTAALEHPEVVEEACRRFAGRVAVGIDARDGQVAVKGWLETTDVTAVELARRCASAGAACVIYTDIARDGTQQGVNVAATRALAEGAGLPVIASGGVGSLHDIAALLPCEAAGVIGVIVGRALYTGAVSLPDAIRLADGPAAG